LWKYLFIVYTSLRAQSYDLRESDISSLAIAALSDISHRRARIIRDNEN